MTSYVIVGAGAAGLYTAWRLLSSGTLQAGDTVQLYEWSQRPGGRIYSYTFPDSIYPPGTKPNGLYCEFGGMRFAVDKSFPNPATIVEGHVLVQQTIIALGLQDKVVPFQASTERMYYLRGKNVYERETADLGRLPYNFNAEFVDFLADNQVPAPFTADNLLGAIAATFAPNLGSANADRANWCKYYANGTVSAADGTASFPAGTAIRDIGYWNLLYDQLGDEGFDYSADGTGYTSNVINWNAADAMQANNDYGSNISYMRLDGGYSLLFEALADKITALAQNYPGSGIFYGQQLTRLTGSVEGKQTECAFATSGQVYTNVIADQLFLALPRRALELVAQGCDSDYLLNDPVMRSYLESSIDQPAIKAVMVFDKAWWTGPDCKYPPKLVAPANAPPNTPAAQNVGGATITDLPLRMVYYFANNIPGGPGTEGGPYVLLASYDDMNYSSFWREVETSEDYVLAPSQIRQPLKGPTSLPVTSPFAGLLIKQLAEVHGTTVDKVPAPLAVYFQDWGQDPFGGGYHGWSAHYNICEVMNSIRSPYQLVLAWRSSLMKTYIIGSCYSFDQAWVEGALCTAESVLQDFVKLPPLNPYIADYALVCKV